MKGINVIYHSCQGESHKSSGKPCQDASFAVNPPKGRYAMAIVSDGHGGGRYFRSDKGSEIIVKVTKEAITEFIKVVRNTKKNPNPFIGQPLSSIGIEDNAKTKREVSEKLRWLTSSIINQWNREISKDAIDSPLSEWELENVDEKYLSEFREKVEKGEDAFEKFYGCTLMAYVQTTEYWFAFQIGDGKVVFFDKVENRIEPSQLIPWDENCFLNKTTSICDSDAANEFRFAYCGNSTFPTAVFLGSDGIDDTFGDGERLYDFYIRLYKEIASTGKRHALETLKRDLPELSRIGSKDDMSVACLYDETVLKENYLLMSQWQLDRLSDEEKSEQSKYEAFTEKIAQLKENAVLTERQRIELQYAQSDLGRAQSALERISREKSSINFDNELFQKNNLTN